MSKLISEGVDHWGLPGFAEEYADETGEAKDSFGNVLWSGNVEGVRVITHGLDASYAKRVAPSLMMAVKKEVEGAKFLMPTSIEIYFGRKKQESDEKVEARPRGDHLHGFDLTDIDASDWKLVLSGVGIRDHEGKIGRDGWQWKGPGILIVTGNNPITGEYALGQREPEENYASYIGIEGEPEKVKIAADMIRELAKNIKDESPGERQFI